MSNDKNISLAFLLTNASHPLLEAWKLNTHHGSLLIHSQVPSCTSRLAMLKFPYMSCIKNISIRQKQLLHYQFSSQPFNYTPQNGPTQVPSKLCVLSHFFIFTDDKIHTLKCPTAAHANGPRSSPIAFTFPFVAYTLHMSHCVCFLL